MTHLVVGIGVPGSGKTTFLTHLAKKRRYEYLSVDLIRKELTGNEADQSVNALAWSIAKGRLSLFLSEEKSVVFDATFAAADERRAFLTYARSNNATVIHGYFFDIPLAAAKERNQNRARSVPLHALERMHEALRRDPPDTSEGFDTIFIVDEFGNAKLK